MTQEAIYRWTYRSFAVVSLIVVVSGVLLVFFYRPTAGASDNVLQSLHLVTTWAWLAMLVAIVALEFGRRSVVSAGALLVNLGIVAGVAFTGYLLPWDQLALNAITVGTDIEGFTPVVGRGNDVQFILIDGNEVSVSTFRLWFFAHIGLGVLVLLPAVFVYRRRKTAQA